MPISFKKSPSLRKAARLAATTGVMMLGMSVFTASGAFAATTSGTANFVDDNSAPLPTSGNARATLFSFTLTPVQVCSGDSASNGFSWYSYLEPQGFDPSTLTLVTGNLSTGNGLYNNNGAAGQQDGNNHATDPGTGFINFPKSPTTDYSWIKTGLHKSGGLIPNGVSATYQVGIVCFDSTGVVKDWWESTVTFTGTNSAFTWAFVLGPPGPGTSVPESPLAIGLPLGGAAVIAGSVYVNRRRSRAGTVAAA